MSTLLERVRAGSEAAPWVVEEIATLTAELARVKAERDAALKDAERYQFLRKEDTWCDDDPQGSSVSLWVRLGEASCTEFDAIVDAAIAAREG